MWPEALGDAVQPPPLRRMPGRPRKNRVREEDEGAAATSIIRRSNTVRCCICKEIGHNKRTCQRAPVRGGRGKGTTQRTTMGRGHKKGASEGQSSGASVSGSATTTNAKGRAQGRGRG